MSCHNLQQNNADSAEEVSEIAPPLPMPRVSIVQTTEEPELVAPDTAPDVKVTDSVTPDEAPSNCPESDGASEKGEIESPLPVTTGQCQNMNWVVTPDKETYRTVLVNYHFQNCQSGGGCCRNGANKPGSKCSCPETACCTRRNRERKDFEEFMKGRKEVEAKLAAAGKPNLETFIFSDRLSHQENVDPRPKKSKAVVLVGEDGNVLTDEPAEQNAEKADCVAVPVSAAQPVSDVKSVAKEVAGTSRPAKTSKKSKEMKESKELNANEKASRSKSTSKRSEIHKQQHLELHRCRVAVELKKLELLQFKIDRERQEMDRAKILFEKQLKLKGHVDLSRDDAEV